MWGAIIFINNITLILWNSCVPLFCTYSSFYDVLRYNNSMIGLHVRANHTVNTLKFAICTKNFESVKESVSQCLLLMTSFGKKYSDFSELKMVINKFQKENSVNIVKKRVTINWGRVKKCPNKALYSKLKYYELQNVLFKIGVQPDRSDDWRKAKSKHIRG